MKNLIAAVDSVLKSAKKQKVKDTVMPMLCTYVSEDNDFGSFVISARSTTEALGILFKKLKINGGHLKSWEINALDDVEVIETF